MGNYKDHLLTDPVMAGLVERFGELPPIQVSKNIFEDIIEAIIGQQLSVKAAATIATRFKALFGNRFPTVEEIIASDTEAIRKAGISYSKISYIKSIAQAVKDKTFDPQSLYDLSDEKVLEELVKLKGVGKWTAEMTLIFSLVRQDIFSLGDLGLRSAVAKLYTIDRDNLSAIEAISEKWSPYRSSASRYLWKSLDNKPD